MNYTDQEKEMQKKKLEEFQIINKRSLENMKPRKFTEYFKDSEYVNQVLAKDKKINKILQEAKIFAHKKKEFKETVLENTNKTQKEILKKEYENSLIQTFRENKNKQTNTNYKDADKFEKKITYVRYADDWIIFVRGTKEDAEKVKNLAATFLKEKLELTLSLEKTKITDLYREKAKFLGFEIFYQKNKLRKEVNKGAEGKTIQRFGLINFHPDTERLENRFLLKKYITKIGFPKEVGFLTVLQDHEIITKYNQFMIALGNYYIRQIKYPSRLGRWIYILYYSCIKTLAAKHKTSTKKIIKTYGHLDLSNPKLNRKKPKATDLRIIANYNYNKQKKWSVLLNYKEVMFLLKKIKDKYTEEKLNSLPHSLVREADMLTLHKVNFRTAFKETSFCAICGKKEKSLHSHHIKPLKWKKNQKIKGYKGFDKIVAALGRKQIPVCAKCHQKIHAGKYNNIELNELYDIRLVAPEGIRKLNTTNPPNGQKPINPSQKLIQIKEKNIEVDEINKTYLNRELKKNLTSQL